MSEADKLFEELGYEKQIEVNHCGISYKKRLENGKIRYIEFIETESFVIARDNYYEYIYLHMEELKAINTKCKELGWIE